MAPTRFILSLTLILVCTLALAQGRPSPKHAQDAQTARDIHADIPKKVKEEKSKILDNFKTWIENYKKTAEKHSNLHPQIHEQVHEQVKKAVEKHVKDRINELIDLTKSLHLAQSVSQSRTNSRGHQQQDNNRHNNNHPNDQRNHQNDQQNHHNDQHNHQNDQRRRESQESNSKENRDDKSKRPETDDARRLNEHLSDIARQIKDLKSKFRNTWDANRKSQIAAKLEDLRKAVQGAVLSSHDNNGSDLRKRDDRDDDINAAVDDSNVILEDEVDEATGNHNITEAVARRNIWNRISETLKSQVKALHAAKEDFLNAKGRLVQAANKLHGTAGFHGPPSNHAIDFQSLVEFKLELSGMLQRKQQFVDQRLLFRKQVRDALNDLFNPQPVVTTDAVQQVSTEEAQETTERSEHITEPAARTEEPAVRTEEPVVRTEEPVVRTEEPAVRTEEPVVRTEEPVVRTEEPVVRTEEPVVRTEEPVVRTEEPVVRTEEPVVRTEEPVVRTDEPIVRTEEPAVRTEESAVRTEEHLSHTTGPAAQTTTEAAGPAEHTTTRVERTPENGGQSASEAAISQASTNSVVGGNQIPEEIASAEIVEDTSSPQPDIASGLGQDSSNTNSNISDANGLRLAANFMGLGDDVGGEGSGTVVVIIVLSCLVICSVVGILGVLSWKRHRRQRLYTRIPSGDVARQFK